MSLGACTTPTASLSTWLNWWAKKGDWQLIWPPTRKPKSKPKYCHCWMRFTDSETVIIPFLPQLMSQGKGSGVEDTIAFDVHAITELQQKGVPPTDDSHKYDYKAVSDAADSDYSKKFSFRCYTVNSWLSTHRVSLDIPLFPCNSLLNRCR